jgi:hypothetical protein
MSNAEVSAEYCQPAFVARNLAMSASCLDTKAYLLELEQIPFDFTHNLHAGNSWKPRGR